MKSRILVTLDEYEKDVSYTTQVYITFFVYKYHIPLFRYWSTRGKYNNYDSAVEHVGFYKDVCCHTRDM